MKAKFFAQLSLIRRTLPGGYAIAGIMIVGLLLWVRGLGALQPLELVVYDRMVRWQPNPAPDPWNQLLKNIGLKKIAQVPLIHSY